MSKKKKKNKNKKKNKQVRQKDVLENNIKDGGDDMYNSIRAQREADAEALNTLNQNTIDNVNAYIHEMDDMIDDIKEDIDHVYNYIGAVNTMRDLSNLDVREIVQQGKVPFAWVSDRNIFMYYINSIWSDDKTVKDWVIVYKDDDLALKTQDGEIRLILFKEIEDITMDDKKIANILSAVYGYDELAVINVIDCMSNGWSADAIYNLDGNIISDFLSLEEVESVMEYYKYWTELGFNRVQVNFDDNVEEDESELDLVELVSEGGELDIDKVSPILQPMNMAEIYNEIVQDRQNNVDINPHKVEFEHNYEEEFEYIDESELESYFEFIDQENDEDGDEDDIESAHDNLMDNTEFITDVYNPSTVILATNREGTTIPSIFGKVTENTPMTKDGRHLEIPEFQMDDNLGNNNIVFEDMDLLVILKSRICALLDLKNENGDLVFKDDKCLNMVVDKITEAQMWLDLWTKTN